MKVPDQAEGGTEGISMKQPIIPCGSIILTLEPETEPAEWCWYGGIFMMQLQGSRSPHFDVDMFVIDLWMKEGDRQVCLASIAGESPPHAAELLYEEAMESSDPDIVRFREEFLSDVGVDWGDTHMFAARVKAALSRTKLGEKRLVLRTSVAGGTILVMEASVQNESGVTMQPCWVHWVGADGAAAFPPRLNENFYLASLSVGMPKVQLVQLVQTWVCPTREAAASICDHWSCGDQLRQPTTALN